MKDRPALLTALVATATVLAGLVLTAGWVGVRTHRLQEQQRVATSTALGTVVEDGIGGEDDIRVRWRDTAGHDHQQRFGIYDIDRYQECATFAVRYDPTHPDRRAFPADPDETLAADDIQAPGLVALVLGVLALLAWTFRGVRYRWGARRPTSPAFGQAFSGELVDGGPIGVATTCWLVLRAVADGPVTAWQRVMWHPGLAQAHGVVPVSLHGDPRRRRPLVIGLPDGTAVVPIGRLRHHAPRRFDLRPRAETTLEDDGVFLFRTGTALPPPCPWWHRPARMFGLGALLGAAAALLLGDPVAALPLTAGFGAVMVNVWAFGGFEA